MNSLTALSVALASSVLPTTPLVPGHFSVFGALTNAVLVLCAIALWFERERTPDSLPHPVDDEHRLAA